MVAKESIFGKRVAHGVLVSGLTSAVLGMQLPGEGTIYLGQDNKFRRPVYIGDTVKATCEVIELNTEKNIAKLATTTTNQNNEIVIEGIEDRKSMEILREVGIWGLQGYLFKSIPFENVDSLV